jgi:predicted RNase H-like HicB family nuclease
MNTVQHFIGLIHKDPKSDYGVSFPDLPGCITVGRTLDEAQRMAEEALTFHLEGLTEDGEPIPSPSSLEEIMSDPHNRGAVAILVATKVPADKVTRVNITVPVTALHDIDRYAAERGLTRSGFLVSAAKQAMNENAPAKGGRRAGRR